MPTRAGETRTADQFPSPVRRVHDKSSHWLRSSVTSSYDRGKCEVEATIHAAHRVNRICFHLMQQDEPFVDQSTPAQRAECARRWRQFRTEKKRRRSRRKRGKRRR